MDENQIDPEVESETSVQTGFSKAGGGTRSKLNCQISEGLEECIARHAAAGWDVTLDNCDAKEMGPDQLELVFKNED